MKNELDPFNSKSSENVKSKPDPFEFDSKSSENMKNADGCLAVDLACCTEKIYCDNSTGTVGKLLFQLWTLS